MPQPRQNVTVFLQTAVRHHQAGRLEDAHNLYEQVLRAQPKNHDALHLLGLIVAAQGDTERGMRLVRQAIGFFPRFPGALRSLAGLLLGCRRPAEALTYYDKAITLQPNCAETFNDRGNALHSLMRDEEALVSYDRAIALKPTFAQAFNNRGVALQSLKRDEEAVVNFEQALALKPDDPSVLNNLAAVLRGLERFDEAAGCVERSLRLDPNNPRTYTCLAMVRFKQKRLDEAEMAALRGLASPGDDALVRLEALHTLGLVRFDQQRSEEAFEFFTRALTLKPDCADACHNIANIHKEAGRLREAREGFVRAIEADPREGMYYLNLSEVKTFAEGDTHLAAMEGLARDMTSLSAISRISLNFALAKAYDDVGRYDDAFRCMRDGNALKRGRIAYDETAVRHIYDRVRATFDRELFQSKTGAGFRSPLPVFVVGMPRSGTTLVEQILASHPSVHGAGEVPDFNNLVDRMNGTSGNSVSYPEGVAALTPAELCDVGKQYIDGLRRLATTAKRVTDKALSNFQFLGFIHLTLPDARIIHVSRDPLDTCLSCFSKLFATEQNYTYDLGELGRYYRKYAELMGHWRSVLPEGRVLEVRYEDVIADLETEARRIVDYCGLPWHPSCLAPHKTNRPIRTASVSQVRRPVYRTSEGRWRVYRDHLGPLVEALGGLA
jgi:tetratricopeptide (TPR) repeat protein